MAEGSTITYTASVDNAPVGSDLVLALSNGEHITILAGENTGSVSYTVRANDPYVQGTLALDPVAISSTSGGNFEDVAKTGTVLTSVADASTTSTVTLSSTADGDGGRRLDDHVHGERGQRACGQRPGVGAVQWGAHHDPGGRKHGQRELHGARE